MNKATVKRVFVLAITAIMLFSVLLPAASAETAAVTGKTTSKIYFRQNPTSAAKPYVAGCTSIPKGAEVEILGFIGAFYKVGYKGYTGYVKSTELTFSGAEAVTRELVYFRTKATSSSSSKYRVVGCPEIPGGAAVKIVGASGSYSKVEYNGFTGYARTADLAVNVADLTPKLESYTVTAVGPFNGKTLALVNFRQFPEASTLLVTKAETIKKGKAVTITGECGDFYRITYNGYTGFALKIDVQKEGQAVDPNSFTVTPISPAKTGTTLDVVNFRTYPTASSGRVPQVDKVKKGQTVSVTGTVGEFYQIQYGGYTGYGYQKDIKLTDGTTVDTGNPPAGGTANIPSGAPTAVAAKMAAAQAKNSDVVGYMYIEGTHIDYPIYNNRYDTKKKNFVYNMDYTHLFTMADPNAQGIACIMGHNMRTSKTMFHDLHHVQNRLTGANNYKCEKCGASAAGLSSNTVFTILYDGYSYYQLFAMYETSTSEPRATLEYNALNSTATGSAKQQWIEYQLMRSQVNFGVSVSSSDKIIILVTCGDKVGGTTGARLYMCLKAVG